FAPTNPKLVPIGHELEERRGWSPPPPSRGLAFAGVSLVLVGIATAGTVFFLSPTSTSETPAKARPLDGGGGDHPRRSSSSCPIGISFGFVGANHCVSTCSAERAERGLAETGGASLVKRGGGFIGGSDDAALDHAGLTLLPCVKVSVLRFGGEDDPVRLP
ncbi:MAG TPA: hypothetical protein VM925_26455, partial [Labilithrix sp.]|nr:hypothetical protein [Labilithrix sp.]